MGEEKMGMPYPEIGIKSGAKEQLIVGDPLGGESDEPKGLPVDPTMPADPTKPEAHTHTLDDEGL